MCSLINPSRDTAALSNGEQIAPISAAASVVIMKPRLASLLILVFIPLLEQAYQRSLTYQTSRFSPRNVAYWKDKWVKSGAYLEVFLFLFACAYINTKENQTLLEFVLNLLFICFWSRYRTKWKMWGCIVLSPKMPRRESSE